MSASPEKQWKTTVPGGPSSASTRSTSSWASRSWIMSALPVRLAMSMWRRKDSSCARLPSGPVRNVSIPVSPTATTCGSAASSAICSTSRSRPSMPTPARALPAQSVSSTSTPSAPSPCTMRGASLGCRAAAAHTRPGWASATSAAHFDDGRSTPTCRSGLTPTLSATPMISSTSGVCMSMWVWLSATGTRRGSGTGGGVCLLRSSTALPLRLPMLSGPSTKAPAGGAPVAPAHRRGSGAAGLSVDLAAQARQLLVDHGLVEFGEERLGPLQRRARGDRHRVPTRDVLVVVPGDDRVVHDLLGTADRVAAGGQVRHAAPLALTPEHGVHLVGRLGQERREQRVGVLDQLQGHVQDGGHALRVGLLERPRGLVGDVLVGLGDGAHGLLQGGLELRALQACADGVEGGARGGHDLLVLLGERARIGHVPDVLGGHRDGTVDEVAPGGDQLVVVAAYELGPGEVCVLGLGAGGHDVVPQRVGGVALQEVAHVDDDAA